MIRGADFVEVWNLLDIVNICGDQGEGDAAVHSLKANHMAGQCDPSLVWWLIEELLDSQEIDGCRVVFDYLESRRARLIEVRLLIGQRICYI